MNSWNIKKRQPVPIYMNNPYKDTEFSNELMSLNFQHARQKPRVRMVARAPRQRVAIRVTVQAPDMRGRTVKLVI